MYAKIENGQVAKYPYSPAELYADNPNVYFPDLASHTIAPFGAVVVVVTGQPQYNRITQAVNELTPVYSQERGRWEQAWQVVDLPANQAAANQVAADAALEAQIVDATQERLDTFARTRNYDSILSACTYSDSLVQKFRTEGQYCLAARDQTWAKIYEMLEEVQAGTRPRPNSFADVEPELPALVWPAA